MSVLAGQKVTADELNAGIDDPVETRLAADEVFTTSLTDVTGVTQNITTVVANTELVITAVCDIGISGSTDFAVVTCVVGGVTQTGNAKLNGQVRGTFTQKWVVNVASASTVTVKLQKQKVSNSNVATLYGTHTKMIIQGNGI